MEKFDSQSRLFILPKIKSFKLMKSNYEVLLAALCENVFPQNKME